MLAIPAKDLTIIACPAHYGIKYQILFKFINVKFFNGWRSRTFLFFLIQANISTTHWLEHLVLFLEKHRLHLRMILRLLYKTASVLEQMFCQNHIILNNNGSFYQLKVWRRCSFNTSHFKSHKSSTGLVEQWYKSREDSHWKYSIFWRFFFILSNKKWEWSLYIRLVRVELERACSCKEQKQASS
jgi:hypothetical protein